MADHPSTPTLPQRTGPFRRATAVAPIGPDSFPSPLDPGPHEPGAAAVTRRWSSQIAQGWDIRGNANGGYMLAVAGRAMAEHLGRPDPVTVTGHFLAPGKTGPLEVEVTTVRAGGRFSTARADLLAGDKVLLSTLGTFSDLSTAGEPLRVEGSPPDLPPLSECQDAGAVEFDPPSFMNRVELFLHPDDAGFGRGEPSGEARVRGWFSLPDDEPVDTIALLCVLDAFPPTVFNMSLPRGWVPTLEFTAHVRGRPAPGPLACEFATRFVTGGFLEEDGLIWDSTGRLVGQSRQLALLPREP